MTTPPRSVGSPEEPLVLAEICHQLDVQSGPVNSEASSSSEFPSDTEVFQALLTKAEVDINLSSMEAAAQNEVSFETSSVEVEDGEQLYTVFDDTSPGELLSGMGSSESEPTDFLGACIDTDAQMSVIRKRQAIFYCVLTSMPFQVDAGTPQRVYKFDERRYTGLDKLDIRIPVKIQRFIFANVEFVGLDVPFL